MGPIFMVMKVLVACEFSGRVREAFANKGHHATSCDVRATEQPCSTNATHIRGDVRRILDQGWDLMIAHPPCTYLANVGVQYLDRPGRRDRMVEAAAFFNLLLDAPIDKIAVENPIPSPYAADLIGHPTQYIHPHQYGDLYNKRTGLWLRGLPPLIPKWEARTALAQRTPQERMPQWWGGGGRTRKDRSVTSQAFATAMAEQWG